MLKKKTAKKKRKKASTTKLMQTYGNANSEENNPQGLEKKKRKQGRPSLFNEIVAQKIIQLAGSGKTDEQTADIIGVSTQSLRNWRDGNQSLMWSVKEAKMKADEVVEASLYSRASGCKVKEERIDKDGCVHEVWRELPPDPTSMIFWLKNRKPQEWRDRVDIQHGISQLIHVKKNDGSTDDYGS